MLANGELLDAVEGDGIDVLVTTDSNLKHQQNISGRALGIVVLGSTSWPRIRPVAASVVSAVNATVVGTYTEIDVPSESSQ